MEKITLKRKKCVLGELESDESKIISSDIFFNLPSFLLEIIDKETRNRLLISDYSTNDAHGLGVQKKIKTEYRQVVIPRSYLEGNKFASSPSTNDQTDVSLFLDKSIQHDEKPTVSDNPTFSQQTPAPPKSFAERSTSISKHSFQSVGSQATDVKLNDVEDLKQTFVISSNENGATDVKLNDVEDLKRTFVISSNENGVQKVISDENMKRKVLHIKENNSSTLIAPNIWKKTKEIELMLKEKRADATKESQKVKVEGRVSKKTEEQEPSKEVISPEEKDRRRKLVKMQKKRNSKYHINHNHIIINTSLPNNGEQPETNNNRQKLAYNPKEAQMFINKKKQERMMKKRMAEEDLIVKEELKKERLNALRRKQLELAKNSRRRTNHPSKEDATAGNKFNENQKKISAHKETEPLKTYGPPSKSPSLSSSSSSSSSSSASSHVGNEEMEFHPDLVLLPAEKLDEPGAEPRDDSQQEPAAKEILLKYVKENNLRVEDVVVNFYEHAGNIKNFVFLQGHVNREVNGPKDKPSFGSRLDRIQSMSHWLEDKISQTSDMIVTKTDLRGGDDLTVKDDLKLIAVDDQSSRKSNLTPLKQKNVRTNFNQLNLGNKLLRYMDKWNAHREEPSKVEEHQKESRDPFDAVLKDLQEDDPLKIFNILARKQQESRDKLENDVKKINNFKGLKDGGEDAAVGNNDENIDISEDIRTSQSYDDDFENDEDDVDYNGVENEGGSTSCQSLKDDFGGNSSCKDEVREVEDAEITLKPDLIADDAEPSNSTETSEGKHESSVHESSKILQMDRSQQFDAPESMESITCSSSVDKSTVNKASHVIYDQPMAEGDYMRTNMVHLSPADLELRLLAEMNLMEMLDSSLFQLEEIERSRIVSEVKQENLTLNHMMKAQGVVHTAQIDDVMKVLQDGFNDHHQQQQMELNRLQQQLQEQQEQQSALMKNVEQMLQHPNNQQQEHINQQQEHINQQQVPLEKYQEQQTQVHQESRRVDVQQQCEDILGSSLAGVIELQKEAALNLARMTSVMMDSQSGLLNLKDKKASEVMLNNSRDVDPKDSNHGKFSKSFGRKGEVCSSPEEKKTTNIKLKAKTKEPGNTNLNIVRDRSASDVSIATEIEEASEKSNKHESFEEDIETGSYTSTTSIAEEVSIKKGDSYTSSLRSYDDSDTTRSSSRGTSKTLDRLERRTNTNTNEINKNNNKSKNANDEINKDSFGTSMVQIQLKEELAMQEHKLLLLEAKSKYLEESYRNELKELKQQLKNVKSDDAIEKLTKKKMKASLTYKMKKNELKRLMAAVHSSMDAQKMMMLEASSLHARISMKNQVDKSFEGSEVSSPTISSSTEQSKHKEMKVIKSVKDLKDVKVKRADENVSPTKSGYDDDPLKNDMELLGNVGSDNVNQSNHHHHHHHHDLPGGADDDDDEVIHSEVMSLDLKDLGTPVYEGSSVASKNISEEIPDNLPTSYSASSSQSKTPDNSIIGKELNSNVNRNGTERCSTDVDINEEISYESSSKSSHSQSSRKSKSKPHAKFKEATNDDRKKEKKKTEDDVNFLKKTEKEKNDGRDEKEGIEDFESGLPKKRGKLVENNGSKNKTLEKLEHSLTELKVQTTSSEVTSESQDVYNGSSFCSSEARDDVKEDARPLTESNLNKSNEEDSSAHSSSIVDDISIKTNPSSFQVSTQNPLSNRKFSNPSLSSIILPPLDLDLLKRESNENKKNVSTSQEAHHKQLSNNSDQLKQQQQLSKNAQLDSARTLDEIDEEFSWSEEISARISDCHEMSTKNYGNIKNQSKDDDDNEDGEDDEDGEDGANKMSSKKSEGNLNVTEEPRRPQLIGGNDGQLRISDELNKMKGGGTLDDGGMLSFDTSHILKSGSVQADNVNNISGKVDENDDDDDDDEEEENKESEKIPIAEEHNEEVTKHSDVGRESKGTDGNVQEETAKDSVDKTSNEQNKPDNKNRNFTHLLKQSILPQDKIEMQNIQNLGKSSDKNGKPLKSWKDSPSFKNNVLHCDDVNDVPDDDEDDDGDDFSEGTKRNVGQLGNQDMQQEFLGFERNMKGNNRIDEDGETNIHGEEDDIDDEESDDEEEDEESDDDDEDIDSKNANSGGLANYFKFNENSQKLLRPSAIIGRKTNDDSEDHKDKDVDDNDNDADDNADDNWLGSTKDGLLEGGSILNAQELFLNKHEDDFNHESKDVKHSEAKLHNFETVLPLNNGDGDDDDDDDDGHNPDHGNDDDYDDESSEDGNIKAKETASDDDHSFESSSSTTSTTSSSSSSSTARRDGDFSDIKGSHSTGIALHKNQEQFFDRKSVTDNDDVDEIVSEEIVAESDNEDNKENSEEMFGIKSFVDPTTLKDSVDSESMQKNVKEEVTNEEVKKLATTPGRCGDDLETNTENQKAQSETDNEIINEHGVEYNEIRQKLIIESDVLNFHESPIDQIDHQTKKKESSERDECRKAEDVRAGELEWKDFLSADGESIGKQKGGEDFMTPDDDDGDYCADNKSTASSSDNFSENHASRKLVENVDKFSQIKKIVKSDRELEQCEESKECLKQKVKDVGGVGNSDKVLPSSIDDDSEISDSPLLAIDGLNNYLGFESKEIQKVEGTHLDDFAAVTEHSADQDDGKDEGSDDGDDQPTEEDAESITNEAETSGDIPEEILEHSSHAEVERRYDSPNKNKHEDENSFNEVEEVSDVESQSLLDLLDDLP